MSPSERAKAAIAQFQHANESLHRHPDVNEPTCEYCNLVGHYAVRTLLADPGLLFDLAIQAGALEPSGLIWRPKAGSQRWQHRQHLDGRGYPKTAEFVDMFRRVSTDGSGK